MQDWLSTVNWGAVASIGLLIVGVATFWVRKGLLDLGKRQEKAEQRSTEAMETIQRRQAGALERLAGALAGSAQIPTPAGDATLSMWFESEGRSHRLLIENRGPGAATIVSVESLNDANLLVEPLGLDDLTLLAGEEHSILAAPSLATPAYVKVLVSWIDGRGLQSREQTLHI